MANAKSGHPLDGIVTYRVIKGASLCATNSYMHAPGDIIEGILKCVPRKRCQEPLPP